MSTQYRLVQSGKTASGGCSAGQGSSEPVAPRIIIINIIIMYFIQWTYLLCILNSVHCNLWSKVEVPKML
jgi:hypothetical protein